VVIDFHGFIEAVDLVGGIDVDIPKTVHDVEYPNGNDGYTTFHLNA
jgi:anionic cell wall polymer biosynthesis LytR-Cps2A-Psr (LCP) family protein